MCSFGVRVAMRSLVAGLDRIGGRAFRSPSEREVACPIGTCQGVGERCLFESIADVEVQAAAAMDRKLFVERLLNENVRECKPVAAVAQLNNDPRLERCIERI